MLFNLRAANKDDVTAILGLIKELAIFEKAEHKVKVTQEMLIKDGFGENPLFQCIVAENDLGKVVGMCFFFTKYSTWRGKGFYLDDLVVTNSYRNKGVGLALLQALIAKAKEEKMEFVQWQVLDWNVDAIRFYKRVGAELDAEWVNCMVEAKDF
jgi:GNAT superfamily N-acetyltransferase